MSAGGEDKRERSRRDRQRVKITGVLSCLALSCVLCDEKRFLVRVGGGEASAGVPHGPSMCFVSVEGFCMCGGSRGVAFGYIGP